MRFIVENNKLILNKNTKIQMKDHLDLLTCIFPDLELIDESTSEKRFGNIDSSIQIVVDKDDRLMLLTISKRHAVIYSSKNLTNFETVKEFAFYLKKYDDNLIYDLPYSVESHHLNIGGYSYSGEKLEAIYFFDTDYFS